MKVYVLILIAALAPSLSHAKSGGDIAGNGGDGVIINNKPYLYDLVEAGVQTEPDFDNQLEILPNIRMNLEKAFPKPHGLNLDLLARKLTEIYSVDKMFGASLLYAMKQYSWRWIDRNLYDVPDDGDTVVVVDKKNMVQLAVRYSRSVTIDRKLWQELDEANQVALVLHEMIYAMIKPEQISDNAWEQNANLARQITGYLFTGDLRKGKDSLNSVIRNLLPTEEALAEFAKRFYFRDGYRRANCCWRYFPQGIDFPKVGLSEHGVIASPQLMVKAEWETSGFLIFSGDYGQSEHYGIGIDYSDERVRSITDMLCKFVADPNPSEVKIKYVDGDLAYYFEFSDYIPKNGAKNIYLSFDFGYLFENREPQIWKSELSARDIVDQCKRGELFNFVKGWQNEWLKHSGWLN